MTFFAVAACGARGERRPTPAPMRRALLFLGACLAASRLFLFAAAPERFETLVARGKQFAAEKSWAQAREAFAAAQPLARVENDRRWCAFWLADATWRASVPGDRDYLKREAWRKEHLTALDALLGPYPTQESRDELWLALTESRGALERHSNNADAGWKDWLDIADYRASAPPTPENARKYLDFLRRIAADLGPYVSGTVRERLAEHLRIAGRAAAEAEQRAWAACTGARLVTLSRGVASEEGMRRWREALAIAEVTAWAPLARAEEFLFRARRGFDPAQPPDTPADVPALLRELAQRREGLRSVPDALQPAPTRKALDALERWWTDATVLLDAASRATPGQPVPYRFAATGVAEVTIEVFRHTLESWMTRPADATGLERAGIDPSTGTALKEAEALRRQAERVRVLSAPLPGVERRAWHSEARHLEPLPVGFYSLLVSAERGGERFVGMRHLIVSDAMAALVQSDPGGVQLHVVDTASLEPLVNRPARGFQRGQAKSEPWTGATDEKGFITLPEPPDVRAADWWQLAGLVDGRPVSLDGWRHSTERSRLVAELILDRPLYRPGETVHWKLVVRERAGGEFVVPKNRKLSFSVRLRYNEDPLLEQQPVTLSDLGTCDGAFVIPLTARGGEAHAELAIDPQTERGAATFYSAFVVDNFQPPPVRVDARFLGDWRSLQPGGEVEVEFRAQYFSGGPVPDAPVTAQIKVSGAAETIADFGVRMQFKSWQEMLEKQTHRARTDRDGRAVFRVTVPRTVPAPAYLSVEGTVTPLGAPPIEKDVRLELIAGGLRIDPAGGFDTQAVRPGERVGIQGRLVDARNEPAVFTGRVRWVEKRWEELWLDPNGRVVSGAELAQALASHRHALYSNFQLPRPWRKLHSGYAVQTLENVEVRTDADGRFRVDVAPPRAGVFQLRFGADEIFPPEVEPFLRPPPESELRESAFTVVAADENTRALALPPRPVTLFAPAKLQPGEKLRLLVATSGARKGWVTIDGEETSRTQVFALEHDVGWLTIDALPAFVGSGRASVVVWTGPHQLAAAEDRFECDEPRGRLRVEVAPANASARPGENTAVVLRVTDAKGGPAPAELSLAVSDEAVNRLIRPRTEARPTFWDRGAPPRSLAMSVLRDALRDEDLSSPIVDPRPGAVLNRSKPLNYDDTDSLRALGAARGGMIGAAASANGPMADSAGQEKLFELRRSFASTATWQPKIATDARGEARVTFAYPANLTRWEFDAYAVGTDGKSFGRARAYTTASLPFQARVQAPRFLVAGDAARIPATLVNRGDATAKPIIRWEAAGSIAASPADLAERTAPESPAGGEAHVDLPVRATASGAATLRLFARAGDERDAMEQTIPVLENGTPQHVVASGRLGATEKTLALPLALPAPLDPQRTTARVMVSSGYGGVMLDALPYLIDYPYGCVEQTMSRFLPAVVAKHALVKLGLEPAAVEKRILAQESASEATRRRKSAGLHKLDDVVAQSLARLASARSEEQRGDGYGWWPGQSHSDPWMTAYVAWGLALAADAGIEFPKNLLPDRALLDACETLEPSDDRLPWTLLAVVRATLRPPGEHQAADRIARAAFQRAYAARDKYSAAARACLAVASTALGTAEQRAVLLRNVESGARETRVGGGPVLVHWGATENYYGAMDGAPEATALNVLALLELEPKHRLIEPALQWLVLNRRSGGWRSTRDTAFAAIALARALDAGREGMSEARLEISVNRRAVGRLDVSRAQLLAGPAELAIAPAHLRAGENRIELRRLEGSAPVHALVHAAAWARADAIKPAAHHVAVERVLERQQAQPTLAGTVRFTPVRLAPGGRVEQGESVIARVALNVAVPLDYVMVEVPKPAGCEPASALSGWDARLLPAGDAGKQKDKDVDDDDRAIYREEHDEKSVFFLDHIDAGKWEIQFALRAVTAGDFQTLPATIEAMYVPEIRGNSDARRLVIGAP